MSAGGGCEAAVSVRTRCEWVKLRECSELQHSKRFPLRLKGAVYKSYVRPAILHVSEAWCLKENEMRILRRTERSMVRAMCGVQLKDRKRSMDYGYVGYKLNLTSVGHGKQCLLVWLCDEERGWSCLG